MNKTILNRYLYECIYTPFYAQHPYWSNFAERVMLKPSESLVGANIKT